MTQEHRTCYSLGKTVISFVQSKSFGTEKGATEEVADLTKAWVPVCCTCVNELFWEDFYLEQASLNKISFIARVCCVAGPEGFRIVSPRGIDFEIFRESTTKFSRHKYELAVCFRVYIVWSCIYFEMKCRTSWRCFYSKWNGMVNVSVPPPVSMGRAQQTAIPLAFKSFGKMERVKYSWWDRGFQETPRSNKSGGS